MYVLAATEAMGNSVSDSNGGVAAGLDRLQCDPTPDLLELLPRLIVTVAAWKGGVGKTELAKELAWVLDAVLVDLDWDDGGSTRSWGYRHETRVNAPLLDALERNTVPRPLSGAGLRADLIPSHPELTNNQPAPDRMATALERWSQALCRPLVIDTHPGGVDATMGAVAAAHVIVVPINLETKALRAAESMANELQGYPLLFVPNRIEASPESELRELRRISDTYGVPVGPVIYKHSFLPRRKLTMAVCAPGRSGRMPARTKHFVAEIHDLARRVLVEAASATQRG